MPYLLKENRRKQNDCKTDHTIDVFKQCETLSIL